jgi:hypothetical protein
MRLSLGVGRLASMGTAIGPYCPDFPEGSHVRIVDRASLGEFRNERAFHTPAPRATRIWRTERRLGAVFFYHGGDELYELAGVPGVWHETCLAQHD